MRRRNFLRSGVAVPAGALTTAAAATAPAQNAPTVSKIHGPGVARILTYSAEEHRRRLLNVRECEQSVHKCLRKHLVTGYIPGQVAYHLGEYPARQPFEIGTAYDEAELDRLHADGIRLIQVMEEWNDLLRLFGGEKFTAVNSNGLRRFIDMVHRRGMKMLLYMSTGHFQRTDRDFKQEWARPRLFRPWRPLAVGRLFARQPPMAGIRIINHKLERASHIIERTHKDLYLKAEVAPNRGHGNLATKTSQRGNQALAFSSRSLLKLALLCLKVYDFT